MKLCLLFLIVLSLSCTSFSFLFVLDKEWENYKIKYAKSYKNPLEDQMRMRLWRMNSKMVARHNEKIPTRGVSYEMEVNKFSDFTKAELQRLTGLKIPNRRPAPIAQLPPPSLKNTVDWRELGNVTGVKDQGNCGSCYAFSSVGAIEGAHFIANKKLVSLSEQQIIDCDPTEQGCEGGFMDHVYEYLIEKDGIESEATYPYRGSDNGTCSFAKNSVAATVTSFSSIPEDEDALKDAVATLGPVSVGIHAEYSLIHYKSGVYFSASCNFFRINHAVLVVGYGNEGGNDYWLVKNSWGTNWGEEGYVKMSRNRGNNCEIAPYATIPTSA